MTSRPAPKQASPIEATAARGNSANRSARPLAQDKATLSWIACRPFCSLDRPSLSAWAIGMDHPAFASKGGAPSVDNANVGCGSGRICGSGIAWGARARASTDQRRER